jgi:hypothetical protein
MAFLVRRLQTDGAAPFRSPRTTAGCIVAPTQVLPRPAQRAPSENTLLRRLASGHPCSLLGRFRAKPEAASRGSDQRFASRGFTAGEVSTRKLPGLSQAEASG